MVVHNVTEVEVCGFAPFSLVHCDVRALNYLGSSDFTHSKTTRMLCAGGCLSSNRLPVSSLSEKIQ